MRHLSKADVNWTTQWRHIDMAHSCSKALQSVSTLARIDDFFFGSELANARPLNCSDTAGTGLIVEANSLQEGAVRYPLGSRRTLFSRVPTSEAWEERIGANSRNGRKLPHNYNSPRFIAGARRAMTLAWQSASRL